MLNIMKELQCFLNFHGEQDDLIYTQLLYCEHTKEPKTHPVTGFPGFQFKRQKDNKLIVTVKKNARNKIVGEVLFCKNCTLQGCTFFFVVCFAVLRLYRRRILGVFLNFQR